MAQHALGHDGCLPAGAAPRGLHGLPPLGEVRPADRCP